jgi:predicted RNase H-like HicB family nuclease
MREFHVVVTQDEEGYFGAEVSELSGCHTQTKSHDELMERIKETIELYLDVLEGQIPEEIKIIETQEALT